MQTPNDVPGIVPFFIQESGWYEKVDSNFAYVLFWDSDMLRSEETFVAFSFSHTTHVWFPDLSIRAALLSTGHQENFNHLAGIFLDVNFQSKSVNR